MAKSLKDFKNTILIADENINRRNNTSSRLRMLGYETEMSTGGFHIIHLLEMAQENGFRYRMLAIFEDMEDMAGKEVLSLARDIEDKENMPILYLSKNKDAQEVLDTMQAGANEYISDIENFKTILDKIKKFAPLKK
ncbi:response regulator [Bacteriovoracaceae bacterium]|nr:response regulator [Bacteriovoracaceae bacterium]